ncbi:putative transcription factor bZIP family [Helianthus annuus]|nr:putative transcription factor bZIP family [Helianthus annuus]KAJ0445388.1 putative transcription factor bZIP family [Helianthus annuus]KAJ0462474.1 putative transcription factor bZIP family [Helianthus annuus]KAJ0642879.1 putative transcription factor bZIP family [Helianthus annuus]KAJ0646737.1 putative transcription factor bZIP family [Helianthus annuus]
MVVCGVPKFLESTQFLLSSSDDHQDSTLRKRKRMISNRESARRSRIRKKKHLGDLVLQVSQLVSDNKHMAINLKDTTQMYLNLEYENSILRTQLAELTHRLESLTNIINGFSSLSDNYGTEASIMLGMDDALLVHCDNMLHDNEHFMVEMFLN